MKTRRDSVKNKNKRVLKKLKLSFPDDLRIKSSD